MTKKDDHYVYILTNEHHTVLYVGCTHDIYQRVKEHKSGVFLKSFTKRYSVTKLVYKEYYNTKAEAYHMEWTIKRWNRQWKINLINKTNPEWRDLFFDLL